jgi:BASS family bile acid:Na+ symporter
MSKFLDVLALIGRYGTQGFAVSIFLGLAMPGAAAFARPLLGLCIFTFTMLTFLRADFRIIRRILREPARLALACLWLIGLPGLLIGTALALLGRGTLDPGMVLGLAIIAAAPPILSGPSVAALIGIEPSLLFSATIMTTLLSPLVAPMIADLVAGAAVPVDRSALMLRLAVFIGSATLAALAARQAIGEEKLAAHHRAMDGAGVICYFVFAIAAMDGVTDAILTRPRVVATFIAVAFAVSLACLLVSWAALRWMSPGNRVMFGYGAAHRNMGVLIATLGAAVPDTTFLFFALAQFPIYLMPQIIKSAAPLVIGGMREEPPVAGP